MRLISLNQLAPFTDDFSFTSLTDATSQDAIVICHPSDAACIAPTFLRSRKTLDEHMLHIRENQIRKALVVAEDISFLPQCPSLEYLHIIPAFSAHDFDFSPLYDMPNIRWLQCETVYGPNVDRFSSVDYGKIKGIQRLAAVGGKGHNNISALKELKTLYFEQGQPASGTLLHAFDGTILEKLVLCFTPIRTLDGLEQAKSLRFLELVHNRWLEDISALASVKESLVSLSIEKCSRIQDFSALSELRNLERLTLVGTNSLPDLSFIQHMRNLKSFTCRMNVSDGDLSMCHSIPYVSIQNRKHYSHKDKDFTKVSAFSAMPPMYD